MTGTGKEDEEGREREEEKGKGGETVGYINRQQEAGTKRQKQTE